jgi:putative transposase
MDIFRASRNSTLLLHEVYFWTATIKNWKHLLGNDEFKSVIIDSLKELVAREKIAVYAFAIMPNHIHLIWEMRALNGKEMPHASFNKFTAHQFQELLRQNHPKLLEPFKVEELERKYRFWQRNALAILMDSREKVFQKIEYIHNNPLQEKWNLVKEPEDYKWSSAKFYETGIDDFFFLTNITEVF